MALFQAPDNAELAVLELSLNGFTEKDVGMVLFSTVPPASPGKGGLIGWLSRGGIFGDTIDRSDGISVMDGISIGAVMLGILGLVWGTVLAGGPVTWGTLGMLGGGLIGYIFDRLIPEKRRDQYEMSRIEGLVMLEVTTSASEQTDQVKRILEGHQVKQIAVLQDGVASAPAGGSGGESDRKLSGKKPVAPWRPPVP